MPSQSPISLSSAPISTSENLAPVHCSPTPDNTASFLSRLPSKKQVAIREILRTFDLPDDQHEEYMEILVTHMKIAIDGYLARFKYP